jgi:hypothetical protein
MRDFPSAVAQARQIPSLSAHGVAAAGAARRNAFARRQITIDV